MTACMEVAEAIRSFLKDPAYASYQRMMAAASPAAGAQLPESTERRLEEAVLRAAESADWRLASSAVFDLRYDVRGHFERKAEIISRGLLSRYSSVRQASAWAINSARLSILVLRELEARPPQDLMVWDVLMAVDEMATHLRSPGRRQRLVRFVQRLARQRTRSGLLRWKIDETLHSHLHLNQPEEEPEPGGR